MNFDLQNLSDFAELINDATRILIISHRNPDPDTIGSNLALFNWLETIGKKPQSVCKDMIPGTCSFLKRSENYLTTFDYEDYDLIITVDTSSPEQFGFNGELLEKIVSGPTPLIIIDHHKTNRTCGKVNIINDKAASTTLIIHSLFRIFDVRVTPAIATCLLSGLYGDTGSFMHSNTDSESMEIAAELIQKGADHTRIVKNLFKTRPLEQLYLWGKIFSEAAMTDKDIVVAAVQDKDYERLHTDPQSLNGVIDYLNSVKDSKISALLTEDNKGNIKGSLRTRRDDIDLTEIAKDFGGGGHKKASGFTIPGRLKKELHWKIIPG